jgi:hypothetical protein
LDISCEDDDADCGGDRNVVFCEIDSVGWGIEFMVDWLDQRVRNFPWLLIVDDRLERSFPSTLTNSVSKKKMKIWRKFFDEKIELTFS